MSATLWLFLLAGGAAGLGIAMSVASKWATIVAATITLIGALGLAYFLFNGQSIGVQDPPDAGLSAPPRP
ncbi:hypothetical protein MRBLMR1_003879 [Neorhizobium sp. LMR1-1-1.1]